MESWSHGPVDAAQQGMSPLPGSSRMEQLVESIAERVVGLVIEAIDVNALVARVDMDALLAGVDIDAIVSRVEVDALIDRVDVEKIIDRVDVDKIVSRVDVDQIVSRVDVEKIIDRVDIEKVVQRVDIDSLVEQTELGTIIARSTSGVASEALDLVRAQGVGLDDFLARWVNRILRRNADDWPPGPPALVAALAVAETPSLIAESDR
ncbi:MAG: hypothetical protein ABSF84_00725 [Acidimicrobiales bacterium]|jgi:hypothetical protein